MYLRSNNVSPQLLDFFQENGSYTLPPVSLVEEISHWGECNNLSFIQHLQVSTAYRNRTLTTEHAQTALQ